MEAAHTAARRDSYSGSVYQHLAERKGTGKAAVALARKMAEVIWHLLTEERAYRVRGKHPQAGPGQPMTGRA